MCQNDIKIFLKIASGFHKPLKIAPSITMVSYNCIFEL